MTHAPAARPRRVIDAGRLWSGGLATALVAALIAVAGIVIARGLFHVPVLAPEGRGAWGTASTGWYALGAAGVALLATCLLHALLVGTPQPLRFFSWLVGLATLIAALAPFVPDADLAAQVAACVINVVIGTAIGSLLTAVARGSSRPSLQPV